MQAANAANSANAVATNAVQSISAVEDPSALLVSAAIIVVGGLVGGFAAFLTEDPDADLPPGGSRRRVFRFLMLGLVAAACVPLFLSLVRSEIMQSILATSSDDRLESYLVFGGLCLIAAYSARSFITSISQRVLQQIEEVREETRRTSEKVDDIAQDVAAEIEGADALSGSPPPVEIQEDMTDQEKPPAALSIQERRALEALAKKTYRTRTGVAEDSGIALNKISEVLEDLAAKKLVLLTKSARTGGARWAISKRGIEALDAR